MIVLIDGKIYDSTKTPILIEFDENEERIFEMKRFVSGPQCSTAKERHALITTDLTKITIPNNDYSKIQEKCFVCEVEDSLGEERGTQSHPINCGWRERRERAGYIKGLERIINVLFFTTTNKSKEDLVNEIRNIASSSLCHRYDIKESK